MKVYDNGWYRIKGSTVTSHYFHNDKPLHVLNYGSMTETDHSKRYPSKWKLCRKCFVILQAYSNTSLDNRQV